jgi:peroxiredoxin Q/BCP
MNQPGKKLQVGSPAPEFVLPGSDGNEYDLRSYRDQKAVVLAWFPKAYTPG